MVSCRFPGLIQAYAGVGQAVDLRVNESLAYDYVNQYAIRTNHKKAMKELREIGKPPYKDIIPSTKVRSRWTSRFHARFYHVSMLKFMLKFLIASEYNIADVIRFQKGSSFSFHAMWEEITGLNLFELAPAIDIPVYFMLGKYDFTTPFDIAVRYCEKLTAPYKEIVWFENSAHLIPFEEPDKFQKILTEKFKS